MKSIIATVVLLACHTEFWDDNNRKSEFEQTVVVNFSKKTISIQDENYKIERINDGYIKFSQEYNKFIFRYGEIDRVTGVMRHHTLFSSIKDDKGDPKSNFSLSKCKVADKLF